MIFLRLKSRHIPWLLTFLLFLSTCQPMPPTSTVPPDATKGLGTNKVILVPKTPPMPKQIIRKKKHLVVSANPYATRAGDEILRKGGSALDAAIAIQMVLNLVEPQSSGIGGGAFLLHFNASTGEIDAFDGREIAPRKATPDMFQDANGKNLKFIDAVPGGLSVGIPGLLRMLEMAHRKHGKLPWKSLFERAIQLAEDGFIISPRLNKMISRDHHLKKFVTTFRYFFDENGLAKPAGSLLKNTDLAKTFRTISKSGAEAFYKGAIALDIVKKVKSTKNNPGNITVDDLSSYSAKRRESLCTPYRKWFVCGMPPPTSGGVTTLQILGILKSIGIENYKPNSTKAVHMIAEASRLAFADRNLYIADPDFVNVPIGRLIDPVYLQQRAKLIFKNRSLGKAEPGILNKKLSNRFEPDDSSKGNSTSHLTVVDKNGDVVSMTTTIESAFGSRLMVRGFLLNNQLTDFSFSPIKKGKLVANSVWPGKRPRSSMAPTIVFDNQGKPVLALGSPGGSRIIGYVTKSIIAILDWKVNIQSAIELPHFVNRNSYTEIEKGTSLVGIKPELELLGHKVRIVNMNSGLHGIHITDKGLEGGVDPRREGSSIGE